MAMSFGFAMSCDVGCRRGSDPTLLWLWHRPAAAAPIRLLAWELPYASGAALKKKKKKKPCLRRVLNSSFAIIFYIPTGKWNLTNNGLDSSSCSHLKMSRICHSQRQITVSEVDLTLPAWGRPNNHFWKK